MRDEDRRELAEMKARGEGEKSIAAYFKMMGYTEQEVLAQMGAVKPAEQGAEESVPLSLAKISTKGKPGVQIVVAVLLVVGFLAVIGYAALPYLNVPELPQENKAVWKVSATVVSCAPSGAALRVANADISGMPLTEFRIRENNATCSPPTDLQSQGIGAVVSCAGGFANGTVYTLASNNTIDDGFVCRYQ